MFDGDTGPNTGGMGAYCPAPLGTPKLLAELDETVFVPTVHAMKRGRFPFQGVLYAGIMLTNQGPRVLEFNCRFGDPETQPLLMRLKTDLLDLLEAVADERLHEFEGKVEWDPRPAVCVVLCSGGYPGKYDTGKPITGIADADELPDVKVFHAGTKLDEQEPGGDRRRAGARRDGPGRRPRGGEGPGLRGGEADQLRRDALPHRHRRQGAQGEAAGCRPEAPKLPAKFRRPGERRGDEAGGELSIHDPKYDHPPPLAPSPGPSAISRIASGYASHSAANTRAASVSGSSPSFTGTHFCTRIGPVS